MKNTAIERIELRILPVICSKKPNKNRVVTSQAMNTDTATLTPYSLMRGAGEVYNVKKPTAVVRAVKKLGKNKLRTSRCHKTINR